MTSVRIFVAALGNEFMLDIARALFDGFLALGAPCSLELERVPDSGSTEEFQIVIAPHEYFLLSAAASLAEPERLSVLRAVFVVNVEQPGSSWFERAYDSARLAKGVFDISQEGTAEFRRRGVRAECLPLGISPSFVAADPSPVLERPIDVLFMGHASPRREQFIASNGEFFSHPRCRVVLADVAHPRVASTPGYFGGADRLRLVSSSRILLNVHSTDRTYFETHRALLALANGCLLITEDSRHTGPLREWEHFAMAPLEDLIDLCRTYLDDPARLERTALAGCTFAHESMPMSAACRRMLERFEDAVSRDPRTVISASWDSVSARAEVIARLTEASARRRRGTSDRDLIHNDAYPSVSKPAVTVIVTLYNYEAHIGECLRSVLNANSPPGGLELVVVDDASTDGSLAQARHILERASIPTLLVAKHLNTGLADGRNVGLEHARGEAVFMLDADNWIYPSCLETLYDALREGELAATYGILRRFSDETGEALGLLSKFEWSVRDLVRGPYIDAMAMFKRQAVIDVGGYATDLVEYGWFGWEDYALWLSIAQAGLQCRLVPVAVGGYREHSGSMIHRTNTSTERIARYFMKKYGRLVREHSASDRYFGFPASVIAPGLFAPEPAEKPTLLQPDPGDLSAHCRELQRQIDELHASISWRVTAPLRRIYDLLGLGQLGR